MTNSEGNHGEDVKEYYFYLDSTPTHSFMKYLYKYPQQDFPYATWWKRTGAGLVKNSSMNYSILGCLIMTGILMCSSNMPRQILKTF